MPRYIGTRAMGIRMPIIQANDDLASIVVENLLKAVAKDEIILNDRDIVGITESIVAKAQNNFVSIQDIASDIKSKFNGEEVAVIFPITSRNRFINILKGIALGSKKVHVLLSYPQDEVGNPVCDMETFLELEDKLENRLYTEAEFRTLFKDLKHHFTDVDYVKLYTEIADNVEVYFSNNPKDILQKTNNVITAEIHNRQITINRLNKAGVTKVYSLADVLSTPNPNHGYNPEYGLLGSNISQEDTLKLFPRDVFPFVLKVQQLLKEATNKDIEVLVYGDGAFKDPVCGIWELADPVVSPGFTKGLIGKPNELKLKYIADDHLKELNSTDKMDQIVSMVSNKISDEETFKEGTTPRNYTDLLGSLCDLISGSGDKGTPVVLIQGYFDDISSK
ncbi:MAG: coenzyme F420-0:L-glutamate ligase [Bacilli bacterium]